MVKREWDKFDEEAEKEGAAMAGRKGRRLDPKRGHTTRDLTRDLDGGKDLTPDKSERKVNG